MINIVAILDDKYNDNKDFIEVSEFEYNAYVDFLETIYGITNDNEPVKVSEVLKFDGKIVKKRK